MKRPLSLLLLAGSFLFPRSVFADHPFKISEDLDQAIQGGLHELYNFNFEKAQAIFESVQDQADEHPMVAFGIASAHWWRISSFVLSLKSVTATWKA